jgi:hypothetical protein
MIRGFPIQEKRTHLEVLQPVWKIGNIGWG